MTAKETKAHKRERGKGMMKQRGKIILGVVLAIVAGVVVWWLTCKPCEMPPDPPVVEVLKEPLPEDIVGERMEDPVYMASLKGIIDERREVISEAHAVRRQMETMLADAADKIPAATSSEADEAQDPELEAPAPLAPTNAPVAEAEATPGVPINTAFQAGTVLSTPDDAPIDRFEGINPVLLAYVRQQPEWNTLEARLNALSAQRQEIQIRTRTLIRERMEVQYAARAAEYPDPIIRAPDHVVIKPNPNVPDFTQIGTIIITNVPPGMKLPPPPERTQVEMRPYEERYREIEAGR